MGEGWNVSTKIMQTIPNRLDAIWRQLCHLPAIRPYVEEKDIKSYLRRAGAEGNSYRITELGGLGRDLTRGFTAPLKITGRFHKKSGSQLPAFLNRAWSAIFNDDGTLRNIVDAEAVSALNQLTKVFSKMSDALDPRAIDEKLEAEAYDKLAAQQLSLRETWESFDESRVPLGMRISIGEILSRASILVKRVLWHNNQGNPRDLEPEHGSGASACRTSVADRWTNRPRYCPILDKVWPYSEYMCASVHHMSELDLQVNYASNAEYLGSRTGPGWGLAEGEVVRVSRIIAVPKDFRGPRIISAEPRELMWYQKGLQKKFYWIIESNPDTRGLVNFTDQTLNQELARIASVREWIKLCSAKPTGGAQTPLDRISAEYADSLVDFASMDLSNASDGIAWDLVVRLFPADWVEALAAVRTGQGVLQYPDDSETCSIQYAMHAPMGSAVCFPVMALCLWSILTAITPPHLLGRDPILNEDGRAPIWVYGDDIVLPSELVPVASEVLTMLGLTVNMNKTFTRGPFRESCGHEYVHGQQVQPVYLRVTPEDNNAGVAGLCTFSNQLWLKYGNSCNIPELIHDWFPTVPALGIGDQPNPHEFGDHALMLKYFHRLCYEYESVYKLKRRVVRFGNEATKAKLMSLAAEAAAAHSSCADWPKALDYVLRHFCGRAYPTADADFTVSRLIMDAARAESLTPGDARASVSLACFASATWVADEGLSLRYNLDTQCIEMKHAILVPKHTASNRRDCWGDLLRALLKGGEVTVAQRRVELHKLVVRKYVWSPIPGW